MSNLMHYAFAPIDWAYWRPRLVWFAFGGIAASAAWFTIVAFCESSGRANRRFEELWNSRDQ